MNVVYYASDMFSEICGVSIVSLCENNKNADNIHIFVVEDHISDENKEKIRSITNRYGRELSFIRMPSQEEIYPKATMNLGRTYARMAIGELLPANVDRVLSLDSDTLILDSLQEMYNTPFAENEFVAGVYDCMDRASQKRLPKTDEEIQYCNAGVFLIDLKKWRMEHLGEKFPKMVEQYANSDNVLFFLEQDLMNMLFAGHLKLLHPKYDMLTSFTHFDYDELIKLKKPISFYTKEEFEQAKQKTAIVHATVCFCIRKRMWVQNSDHPYAQTYQKYRSMTPWNSEPQIRDNRTMPRKLYTAFWNMLPRSWSIKLASFVIQNIRPQVAKITAKASIAVMAVHSST